jgi:hypothetical protein
MQILNLSYWHWPDLPGHKTMHRDIDDVIKENWNWKKLITEVGEFQPDIIIEREGNNGIALYEPLYRAFPNVPKAWWYIDSHVNYTERIEYAKLFDQLFVAVSVNIPRIKQAVGHDRVYWLPLCWPTTRDKIALNYTTKDIDISFVCRWGSAFFKDRNECIDRLKKEYGNGFLAVTDYTNMDSIVRRSRVSINYPIKDDLNFRVFEVLGNGTELVTKVTPDLQLLPGLLERTSYFVTLDEMVEQIDSVLYGKTKHDMEEVQSFVRLNHSVEDRYSAIINEIFPF